MGLDIRYWILDTRFVIKDIGWQRSISPFDKGETNHAYTTSNFKYPALRDEKRATSNEYQNKLIETKPKMTFQ